MLHSQIMKSDLKQILSIRCPTCGAKVGEKCELNTGQPRTEPHRDRRIEATQRSLLSEAKFNKLAIVTVT